MVGGAMLLTLLGRPAAATEMEAQMKTLGQIAFEGYWGFKNKRFWDASKETQEQWQSAAQAIEQEVMKRYPSGEYAPDRTK